MRENINTRRRSLLKLVFFGSATFVLAKVLGPSLNLFSGSGTEAPKDSTPALATAEAVQNFKNFRVVDNGNELHIFDQHDHELMVIQKDAA